MMKKNSHVLRPLQGWISRYPVLGILPLIALVIFVSAACTLNLGGPKAPAQRAVTAPAQTDWRAVLANAKPGDKISLTLTENDLTAMAASQLAQQNNPDVTIKDPRIVLQNGQMEVYGQVITQSITANFRAINNVRVSDGKPSVEVVSADFGNIPVPSAVRQRMNDMIAQSLSDFTNQASSHFIASNINIADGYMTIDGTVQ